MIVIKQYECAYCGDSIKVGDYYYHYPHLDMNFHEDCIYKDEVLCKKELRMRDDD